MTVKCRACRADTDAFLCESCARTLEQAIAELPSALRDLDVTVALQARVGNDPKPDIDTDPARRGEHALRNTSGMVAFGAAALHAQVVNELGTWARHLAESRGVTVPARTVRQRRDARRLTIRRNRATWTVRPEIVDVQVPLTVIDLCTWLVANIDAIRLDEAAGQIHRRLTRYRARIDQAVDRRDPDVYAGQCTAEDVRTGIDDGGVVTADVVACNTHLLAQHGAEKVQCPACGTVYDVAERREWMLEQIAGRWERPHKIANALTTLDMAVSPDVIRKWIERDRAAIERWQESGGKRPDWPLVLQVGIDDDGRAVFRVGDVQARVEHMKKRSEERKSA